MTPLATHDATSASPSLLRGGRRGRDEAPTNPISAPKTKGVWRRDVGSKPSKANEGVSPCPPTPSPQGSRSEGAQ